MGFTNFISKIIGRSNTDESKPPKDEQIPMVNVSLESNFYSKFGNNKKNGPYKVKTFFQFNDENSNKNTTYIIDGHDQWLSYEQMRKALYSIKPTERQMTRAKNLNIDFVGKGYFELRNAINEESKNLKPTKESIDKLQSVGLEYKEGMSRSEVRKLYHEKKNALDVVEKRDALKERGFKVPKSVTEFELHEIDKEDHPPTEKQHKLLKEAKKRYKTLGSSVPKILTQDNASNLIETIEIAEEEVIGLLTDMVNGINVSPLDFHDSDKSYYVTGVMSEDEKEKLFPLLVEIQLKSNQETLDHAPTMKLLRSHTSSMVFETL